MKKRLFGLSLAALVLAGGLMAAPLARAADNTASNVTLASGQTHVGTYYVAGQNVTIDGNVAGDVICGGQTVTINGNVAGDVICGGQNVTINGAVAGSVRVASQTLAINGTVGRNVTAAGQTVTLGSGAHVGGDVAAAGQAVVIGGIVDRDVYVGAESLALNNQIGGNANVQVSTLSFGSAGLVSGGLTYTSADAQTVDQGKVKGNVVHHTPTKKAPSQKSMAANWIGSWLYSVLAVLAGMLIVVWLMPRPLRVVTDQMLSRPAASVGWGFVGMLGGPFVLILVGLTIIGIPAAIVLGIIWGLALFISGGVASVAVGHLVLRRKKIDQRYLALATLVGVPLTELILVLPVVGALATLGVGAWVLGGMLLSLNRVRGLS